MSSNATLRRRLGVSMVSAGLLVLAAMASGGCGDDGPAIAPVSGMVTHNGQAVPDGSLLFTPMAGGGQGAVGKPATAAIGGDGSYMLGTHSATDGAVVGRHRVAFTPAPVELPAGKVLKPGESLPPSPLDGLVPKQQEVEVKPGKNALDIELVTPATGKKAAVPR